MRYFASCPVFPWRTWLVPVALSLGSWAFANAQNTTPGLLASPMAVTPPPMPPPVTPTGKTELFNGQDDTGWTYCMRGGADPKQTWSIAGGLIHCTGRPLGYMRTLQSYQNYQVTVEYRFVNPGNTGVLVQINLPDQMNPWPKCIECQGLHNHLGDFWFWGGSSCTELRALGVKASGRRHNEVPRPGPSTEKPSGEWNTYTIIASGSTVQTWVNGVLVNQATNCTVTSGFIGLQSEGAKLEVRRVTLEPAPATLAPFTPPAPAAPPAPSATPPLPAASLAPAKSL